MTASQPDSTPPRPPFWRYPLAWSAYGVCWLLAQLPHKLTVQLGKLLGKLLQHSLKSRRQVVERNITACFPKLTAEQRQQLINKNFQETGIMVFQTLRTFLNRRDKNLNQLPISGTEQLQQAIDQGQGVLLVSGHFTALDVGGRAICQKFPVAGVYRPHKHPVQEYIVKRARLKYAAKMFSREQLKGIIKQLKNGGIVWYAPDQDYRRGQSVFADFFGIPAATITATHQLARISNCLVMPYQVQRTTTKPYYQLQIHPPIKNFPSTNPQQDTRQVNQAIESMVTQAPEQYLWLHKRFKTRPQGHPDFYN